MAQKFRKVENHYKASASILPNEHRYVPLPGLQRHPRLKSISRTRAICLAYEYTKSYIFVYSKENLMPQRSSLISNRALVRMRQDFAPRISLSKFRPSPIIVQQLVEPCTLTVGAKKIDYFFPFHESAKNLPRTVASRCLRRL